MRVVAYLLHLGDILPADFVLSDRNIAEVQQRLPNRHGFTREHGLWDLRGKPDVANVACMKDCGPVRGITVTEARDASPGKTASVADVKPGHVGLRYPGSFR